MSELPERIYVENRQYPQEIDGGFWHYEGSPDSIEYNRLGLTSPDSDHAKHAQQLMSRFYHPDGVRKLRGKLSRKAELLLITAKIRDALASVSHEAATSALEQAQSVVRDYQSLSAKDFFDKYQTEDLIAAIGDDSNDD